MYHINGFIADPKLNAQGNLYTGRFTCSAVQWTGEGSEQFATFTITAGELADAAASNILWTDQDVQRGIQPGVHPLPLRELSLAYGFPDSSKYIFDEKNANEMVEKLLYDEQLFLSPLIWNLRPGLFEAYWSDAGQSIHIYSGKIYLPDSHHRHQAIIRAVNIWRESKTDYPKFNEGRQFKVELYFLSREDEGNYFYDKNQRPKPTAKSKAYDLTTQDDLSLLAKKVIENSGNLHENVNRVTDRLDARNPQVVTLSTLREMMRTFAGAESIDSSELDGLATVAGEFYDMICEVRKELSRKDIAERKAIRSELIVDAAVMMHGYAAVMKDFNADIGRFGPNAARQRWKAKLKFLSKENVYTAGNWSGDIFEKKNPLWEMVGVVRSGGEGQKTTVLNTGAARGECGRVLRTLMAVDPRPTDLTFLAKR